MDLAPGSYDTIRANLAHVSHRRWLEAGWQNYHATLLRWAAAGLRQGAPYARFHAAIATAGENTFMRMGPEGVSTVCALSLMSMG